MALAHFPSGQMGTHEFKSRKEFKQDEQMFGPPWHVKHAESHFYSKIFNRISYGFFIFLLVEKNREGKFIFSKCSSSLLG